METPLVQLVARNLTTAFDAAKAAGKFSSERDFAVKAKVAPNTVRYLLNPTRREAGKRGELSPRLDSVAKLAEALGFPVWELLSDQFKPERRLAIVTLQEANWHKDIEKKYAELRAGVPPPATTSVSG